METTVTRSETEAVSVTKSVAEIDGESRLVTLELRSENGDPVHATVTDTVPESSALRLGDGPAGRTDGGGAVVIERQLVPDDVQRIGYVLTGSPPATLPEPRVESAAALPGSPASEIEWVSDDGEQVTLTVVTEAEQEIVCTPFTRAKTGGKHLDGVGVGVILTPTNEDAVVRTVLRATQRGHTALVTSSGLDADAEALQMVETLGATVLSPPSKHASQLELHRLLSGTAREQGLPGIVLQTRDCPRIDYERTAAAFGEVDYEVIAIPELWRQSPDNPDIVVGIPAYNAADSIGAVVERALPFASEVLVVDDGSGDGTGERARAAGATVVSHERNRGYGGALKTVFREAADREAAHLVVIDADGQHDPADIPAIVGTQRRDDADIVIGSRYVGERTTRIPFVRSLGLAVINNLTNASMGKLRPSGFIRDTQSGYRAYNRAAIRSLAADGTIGNNMGASTDILYHAHRNRLSVAEVATTISYEVENASSQGSLSHGLDLVRNIFWTVEYGRPLLILGTPGLLATLLGVTVSVLLLAQYADTGAVATTPLATAVLFALGGLLLCITSLMMSVLNGHPTLRQLADGDNS